MRFLVVLAIPFLVLSAFAVACGDDEQESAVIPSPVNESDGEADWEEPEAEEGDTDGPATDRPCDDFDMDGVCDDDDDDDDNDGYTDAIEEDWGSDPLDDASVPEIEDLNPGSCSDGVDNDGDGLTDRPDDPGCPEAGPLFAPDSDDDGFPDFTEEDVGSDPLDDASVPEHEVPNPGSCADGVDNDLDGDTDDADDGCPLAGFRPVASANLGVTPSDYVGPCPAVFTFAGFITLEAGSGPVSYEFVRSDGVVSHRDPLTFDSPGTQDVSNMWQIWSVPGGGESFSGWMVIRILEPEEVESNTANFTLRCED
jgi:hypothetical protein